MKQMRASAVSRKTGETDISIKLNLDGGSVLVSTGIGFFDHMLNAFAVHGGFGLEVHAVGDLEVDCHHTVAVSYTHLDVYKRQPCYRILRESAKNLTKI